MLKIIVLKNIFNLNYLNFIFFILGWETLEVPKTLHHTNYYYYFHKQNNFLKNNVRNQLASRVI